MTTGWEGATYDAVARPQLDAGARIVEALDAVDLGEDAVVLDAGCGLGRVTELVLDRHPTATVVALDASASMLTTARQRLADHADRVLLVHADLAAPWPLRRPVDAIVSTSTFHWILDHDRLFAEAHAALVPGGSLLAVTGGAGSLQRVRDAARSVGVAVDGVNHYAEADATADRLRRVGFTDVRSRLDPEPITFPDRASFTEYLARAALAPYARGTELAPQVAAALDAPVADFVRLTLTARRPPSTDPLPPTIGVRSLPSTRPPNRRGPTRRPSGGVRGRGRRRDRGRRGGRRRRTGRCAWCRS